MYAKQGAACTQPERNKNKITSEYHDRYLECEYYNVLELWVNWNEY
jgi:hypothetical protein